MNGSLALLWMQMLTAALAAPAALDGSLERYQQTALAVHPALAEVRARAEAALARTGVAGRLPEPSLGVGVFVQPVETRVGPQQARVSLQQQFPWGRAAQRAVAQATSAGAQQDREAAILVRSQRVADAWWTLWELRRTHAVHCTHLDVLVGLSETLRARVEVGAATLADLQQVDLSRALLADRVASMAAQEAQAAAALREAVGLSTGVEVPTEGPEVAALLPAAEPAAVLALARAHPQVVSAGARVTAAAAAERSARASRLPGLAVGADWIVTGPAHHETQQSGKDSLVATVGIALPLWQRSYRQEIRAAAADRGAAEAREAGAGLQAEADASSLLVEVEDTARRLRVVSGALLPQAESAYRSVLGTYAAGKAGVAQVLLAQQTVLELKVAQTEASADHARAWAALESRCGQALERHPISEEP